MSIEIIQNRLSLYNCLNQLEEENALKEITQEIALAALSRINFFRHAQFHGGTALRILYGLQRFSEDLDFTLAEPDENFRWQVYLDKMIDELSHYGYQVEVIDRGKANQTVQKAFLKDNSIGKVLELRYPQAEKSMKKIRIKLEIDINPPAGAGSEIKYLDFPLAFSILAHDVATSFAGKLHALLCRSYIKGRDWYDFLWYVARKAQINYAYLSNALMQNGPWQDVQLKIDLKWLKKQLLEKIHTLDWDNVTQDVRRFLKPNEQQALSVWNQDFFISRIEQLWKGVKY